MNEEVRCLVESWHWMYFEADLLFEGLEEKHLHLRPDPNLLSVSEHVAHLVRSEASIVERYLFVRAESDWADCLMRESRFGWPPDMLKEPVDARLQALSVQEVYESLVGQHRRCYESALRLELSPDHVFSDGWERCRTVGERLRIAAYHVAYHAGQIYSVRHALGEETPEN